MDIKELVKKIIKTDSSVNKAWYLAPLIPAVLWVILSIISIFYVDFSVIKDPFVIISLIARILFPIYSVKFIKRFYIDANFNSLSYNHNLNFVGYSISFTYVSYMLPGVVLDFYNSGASSLSFTIMVILSTACPAALYLLLKNSKVKLASSFFSVSEIEIEKKIKKDKKLKKSHQAGLRKRRSFIQNLWFEAIDPLMWAILWVLLINNTLFQLYQIPSSSMVPEFLEKDRVVASKIFSGPGIPLTNYKLPEIFKPKAGDIVTFNNPLVDDPTSDLHYNNVFTRIFQPFVFMLTFSKLDIDSDENGYPKARQLVKRTIAVPGEKICIVNDKVYKKVEGGDWTLMSDIPGEKEWGHNDLFELDSVNSGAQYINPALRTELDEAASLVFNTNFTTLKSELKNEKALLLNNLNNVDSTILLSIIDSYIRRNQSSYLDALEGIERSYIYMTQVNRANTSLSNKKKIVSDFDKYLSEYSVVTIFDKLYDLSNILESDRKLIEDDFIIDLNIEPNSSPYDEFVITMDGVIKLNSLKIYNHILSTGNFEFDEVTIEKLKKLSIYTVGLQFKSYVQPFFGSGNFPEYPVKKDAYIPENQYFLLGDNRYNSLDSRMGYNRYNISLNPNGGSFSQKISVGWEPHTIGDEYIHGKVSFILFPFSHFKIF